MFLVCCVPCPSPLRPWPAHCPPSLGSTDAELATTTYVSLETVAREEGCGGHVEPLPKGRGQFTFQTLSHPPLELSKTTAPPTEGN